MVRKITLININLDYYRLPTESLTIFITFSDFVNNPTSLRTPGLKVVIYFVNKEAARKPIMY